MTMRVCERRDPRIGLGATLGTHVWLVVFLFGLVMLAAAAGTFGKRAAAGDPLVRIDPLIALRLIGTGLVVGFLPASSGSAAIPDCARDYARKWHGDDQRRQFVTCPNWCIRPYNSGDTRRLRRLGELAGCPRVRRRRHRWRACGVRKSFRLAMQCGVLSKAFAIAVVAVALFVLWKSSADLLA